MKGSVSVMMRVHILGEISHFLNFQCRCFFDVETQTLRKSIQHYNWTERFICKMSYNVGTLGANLGLQQVELDFHFSSKRLPQWLLKRVADI